MPIGYLLFTGALAAVIWSAVSRHRPRRSSPLRLSYLLGGLLLNWPLLVLVLLAASTGLAISQSGVASFGSWIGLAFAILAAIAVLILQRRARGIRPAVESALDEGLGSGWRDRVEAPAHRVQRMANIRYGPAGRANLLDLYRDRSDRSDRPVLIYLHPGAFRFGSKRLGAGHLMRRLASHGWVCINANYRLLGRGSSSDPVVDVKKVISWVRAHGGEYGADPDAVFLAGGSAGAHLASVAALTPGDTSVAGVVGLYGYYGAISVSAEAPPFFVVHGDQDTLVIVEDARRFVEQLRAVSSNPVVYAELPGTQHGFDLFRSRRLDTVIDGIEAFAAWVRRARSHPEARSVLT